MPLINLKSKGVNKHVRDDCQECAVCGESVGKRGEGKFLCEECEKELKGGKANG